MGLLYPYLCKFGKVFLFVLCCAPTISRFLVVSLCLSLPTDCDVARLSCDNLIVHSWYGVAVPLTFSCTTYNLWISRLKVTEPLAILVEISVALATALTVIGVASSIGGDNSLRYQTAKPDN
jgi:hypothetical protein